MAEPFLLVCEVGLSNTVERFSQVDQARERAASYWCCWCLFEQRVGGELVELAAGGLGSRFTTAAIRRYANATLNPLSFHNQRSAAVGDPKIAPGSRVVFGIIFPADLWLQSRYMFFDKEKPVERVVTAAASQVGLQLDKGKLAGSPERLNLFTLEGEVVRLDLEIDAHLGSTLQPGTVLILEKGNRLEASRLEAIRRSLG